MGNQLKLTHDGNKQLSQLQQYRSEAETDQFSLQLSQADKTGDPLKQFLKKDILQIKTIQDLTQCVQSFPDLASVEEEILRRLMNKTVTSIKDAEFEEEDKTTLLSLIQHQIDAILKEKSLNGAAISKGQIDRGHLFKRLRINLGKFIRTSGQDIKDHYNFKQCIGQGTFGRVFRATCKKTNQQRAIKILKNNSQVRDSDKNSQLAEFQLLSELDHPNIVKLYEIFFYKSHYYVVMEYCRGGSLIDWNKKSQSFSEKTICCVMKQLLSTLAYLHKQGICHRDIKLDNMVVMNSKNCNEAQLVIKLIDFGTAVRVSGRKEKIAGTRYYMSPESFRGKVNVKADVWAAGIFMYVLVSGKFPFKAESFQAMSNQVNLKLPSFAGFQWRQVSKQAKKLIMGMLERNPEKRLSANEALNHTWFDKNYLSAKKITYEECNLSMLQKYQRGNNFIAIIQQFLSLKQISQLQRERLGSLFRQLDTNNDGVIEQAQLVEVCQEHFGVQTDSEVQRIFQEIDHNGSGQIDFNQFLVAMYSRKRLFLQESLVQAFKFYDLDKDGYLEKHEIIALLEGCENQQVEYLLSELDIDKDQKVSLGEFMAYLNTSF